MAFAIVGEIVEQWGPLDEYQTARANALLAMAEAMLRKHVNPDGDDHMLAIAKQVSIDMVISALIPGQHRGKTSYSLAAGSFQESATLLNPSATLVFTKEQRALFDLTANAAARWHFGDDPQ
ncbi:hypothetical protein ACS7JX_18970 [Rhodococcus erythropolis]